MSYRRDPNNPHPPFRHKSTFSEKPYRQSYSSSRARKPAVRAIDPTYSVSKRLIVAFVILAAVAAILSLRLLWLQVIDAENNANRSDAVRTNVLEITPRRGTIYDRNGVVLATTVDAINIFCHPKTVPADKVDELAQFMVDNCGGEFVTYKDKILANQNFSYLFKGAEADLGQKILDLGIEGVDYEKTTKRVYPCGSVGSQVIGILNSEGEAISGLELYYNDILGGSPGERTIMYSREGVPVPGSETITQEAVAGKDIVVSIDVGLQEQVETALALRVKDIDGKAGSGIVMDARSGEIYACASDPLFDITDLSEIKEGATNLSGISSAFEPGSIFKPAIMLAALEAGTTQAGQSYYCPASIKVGEYTITDSHERAAMDMDTSKIMADSSNIGMSLIAKDLGAEKMSEYLNKYQIIGKTEVDYPGEASGSLSDWNSWSVVQMYNISFGQGVMTTPLNVVRFYGAIANDGVMCQPHFLIDVPTEEAPRVYETQTVIENKQALDDLTEMMEAVVEDGTATQAQIKGFKIAGKTGTAEIADSAGGYKKNIYNISFVGFIPDASLELVCFVGATDVPAERKTVPAFKDIMSYAIERYDITQK